jgi:drug/metabolite transporter (DMT)-like permease
VCYTTGLKNAEAGKASVIVSIEPAAFWGILFYRELLSPAVVPGILLVIGPILLICGSLSRSPHLPAPPA